MQSKLLGSKTSSLLALDRTKSTIALVVGLSLIAMGFISNPLGSKADDPVVMSVVEQTESTAQEIANTLAGPGVELTNVLINGSAEPSSNEKTAFGVFSNGLDSIGIDAGLVIGANERAGYFTADPLDSLSPLVDPNRSFDTSSTDGSIGKTLFTLASSAALSPGVDNVNNVTELQFTVAPTSDFLKFEYVLAITESGSAAISYPDGIGLFSRTAGGETAWSPSNNCAVIPTTKSYVAMETARIVADRATAQANLEALVAPSLIEGYVPNPNLVVGASGENTIASPGIAYSTQVGEINFLTVPLTCVIDVSAQKAANQSVEIAIAVADFNDGAVPPAVFLQGNSFRFSSSVAPVSAALTNEDTGGNNQGETTPSAPAPSRALTPNPPAQQMVMPGSSAVILGDGNEAHTMTPNVEGGALEITGEGWSAAIAASRPAGKSASVSAPNGDLRVPVSGRLSFNLSGYEPSSQVMVYAMPSGKVVASLTVSKNGTVDYKNVKLPKGVSLANRFLQINGLSESGAVRSITINASMFKRKPVFLGEEGILDKQAKTTIKEILASAKGEKLARCVAYADLESPVDVEAKTLKAQEFCDFVLKQDPTLVTKVVVRAPFKKKMDNRVALRLRG